MPDVVIEKQPTLDLLDDKSPALSTTTDIPVVETKPDASPEKPAAPAEDKPEEGTTTEESAPPEQPEDSSASDEPKKPAKGVQKRIDELVRQREEAERRAEAERQEKLRLLALVERGGKKETTVEENPEPERPNRGQFADQEAFDAALLDYAESKADWSAKRAVKSALEEERKATEQRRIEEGQRAAQSAYLERVAKAETKYPDYKAVAESPNVTVSIPMAQAIVSSEHGPDIAYFLGKNPDEAKRIAGLTPPVQLMELGLLVAKLTASTQAPVAPAAKPIVSAAPKPIKPLESKAEPVKKSPDEETMEEYAARRVKELAAESRPGVRH